MLSFLLDNLAILVPSLVLLLAAALFSCAETVLFSLTRHDLYLFRRSGKRRQALVAALREKSRSLLTIVLLLNMLCTTLVFIFSALLLERLARRVGEGAVLALSLTPVLIVAYFGEVLPKMLGRNFNRRLAPLLALPLAGLVRGLSPVAEALEMLVIRPAGRLLAPPGASNAISAPELREFLRMSQQQGVIDAGEGQLLQQVLSLKDILVRQIMIPRVNMTCFDIHQPMAELRELFQRTHRSKIPVYERQVDNMLGVIYAKTFLLEKPATSAALRTLLKPAPFAPELQTVDRLLGAFRENHTQMAIVVDEYGGIAGLVSLEDVVEQLIGEIYEPHDVVTGVMSPVGPDEWLAAGNVSLLDCAELLSERVPTTRVATVGGLIYAELGRIPRPGDCVRLPHVQLTVQSMRGPRVDQVRIRLTHLPSTGSTGGT